MALTASPVPQRPLAVLAYGSLLREPGPELGALIEGRESCVTPFPVEYGRASRRWGGGPVLVPHPDGAPVRGALLLLAPGVDLGAAVEMLASREGIEGARGVVAVEMPGERLVVCAALPRNLPRPDMGPDALARRAVASAGEGGRNGVAYLRAAVEAGVVTPRTPDYVERVLARVGARTLEDAERVVALEPRTTRGEADGVG